MWLGCTATLLEPPRPYPGVRDKATYPDALREGVETQLLCDFGDAHGVLEYARQQRVFKLFPSVPSQAAREKKEGLDAQADPACWRRSGEGHPSARPR